MYEVAIANKRLEQPVPCSQQASIYLRGIKLFHLQSHEFLFALIIENLNTRPKVIPVTKYLLL